jgi:hypothetical protein
VADYTYYCDVQIDRYTFKKGIYTYSCGKYKGFKYLELIQYSDKVWRQGPRGGVKIVKDSNSRLRYTQYVTTDEKLMKEFMWAKLQAQSYIKGA